MSTVAAHAAAARPMISDMDAGVDNIDAAMLLEVDFKWLMAGHGWWIDPGRLHADVSYARQCLKSAMATNCGALCACAAKLQAQINSARRLHAV